MTDPTVETLEAWRAARPPTGYRIVLLPTRIATLHLERCGKKALGPHRPVTTYQLPPESEPPFATATAAVEVLVDLDTGNYDEGVGLFRELPWRCWGYRVCSSCAAKAPWLVEQVRRHHAAVLAPFEAADAAGLVEHVTLPA